MFTRIRYALKVLVVPSLLLLGQPVGAQLALAVQQPVGHGTARASYRPLAESLAVLRDHYKVDILFESKVVEGLVTSAIWNGSGQSIEQSLDQLLSPFGLKYKKINRHSYTVTVDKNAAVNKSPRTRSKGKNLVGMLPALERMDVSARQVASILQTVSGTIRDEEGSGLPGVTVAIKGTSTGTVSDADGRYSLAVPDERAVLVFSLVGFQTKEVLTGGQTVLDITLSPDIQTVGEVVVVAYGTQSKKGVTGSVASIKARDMQGLAATSVDALLQGKASGVQVVQSTGQPGAEVFVRVRGTASLRADSRPLYVIDGVPMNNIGGTTLDAGGQRNSALADINPADIESMEILKDGSATALYGSRASNGVVLITTKRGKEGKARFNFDSYYGVQTLARKLDLLNESEFTGILRETINNRNNISPNSVDLTRNGYPEALAATGINTDWQDQIFRSAPISSYNLSVAGGQDKIKSFFSLGIFNQDGTVLGQNYGRINGRINLDYQAAEKLKIGTSITFSTSNSRRVTNDFSGASAIGNALLRNPNLPVRNENGSYSVDPLGRNGTENPVMLANEIDFRTRQRRFIANIFAEYEILRGLTFKSVLGYDNLDDRTQRFVPNFVLFTGGVSQAQSLASETGTWVNDNTLNFNRTFNKVHRLSLLGGVGLQGSRSTFLQASGSGAGSNIIKTLAVATADLPFNFNSEWRLLSYFGRANYSFNDKYIIEASFRADGSSRFGANNRFGVFPAVSAAWRIIEEPFLANSTLFSDLKLRAGIGVTGNQEGLENFGSLTRYGTGANYDGGAGIVQANVPNPNLGWESTTTTNVGVDLGLFENRITVNADVYLKQTENLLFTRQLPWTSGFSAIANENVGSLENRGLDLGISTVNIDGAFRWTTDFNISFNRNEITSLPVNGSAGSDLIFKLPDAYSVEGPYTIYRVGQSVGSFYGYRFDGIFATDEEVPANLKDQGRNQNFFGGYPKFFDQNNDGQYDRQNDRVVIGNALPIHTGGITNTFSYKGVELSVFMNWSFGNDINNMTDAVLTSLADDFNQSKSVLNRWQRQGDNTSTPLPMYIANSFQGIAFTDASSRYIEDGSFLRVRNINLGYNLPQQLLRRIRLNSAKIYVSGQNMFLFTKYKGYDPESQNTGGGLVPSLGVDYLTQPIPRVMMFGVNVGF
jgi:TonB-dependent starch-binding outer membrane protein SusC